MQGSRTLSTPKVLKQIQSEVEQLKTDFRNTFYYERRQLAVEGTIRTYVAWDRERLRMVVTHLQHTNAMPLFLSLMTLDSKEIRRRSGLSIERFVFRYKTVVNAHVTPMTNVYLKHAKKYEIQTTTRLNSLRADLTELILKRAPDSIFETGIREIKYLLGRSNTHIRYFFVTMEDYCKWYEDGAQGVPKCKDKKRILDMNNLTVEHIYPQSPFAEDKNDDLENVKDTLGNLTILSPECNDALANKPIAEKLKRFSKSDLKLNRNIASAGEWSTATVEQRTKNLAVTALKVFVP